MYLLNKCKQRGLLIIVIAFLAFTHIPAVKESLLNNDFVSREVLVKRSGKARQLKQPQKPPPQVTSGITVPVAPVQAVVDQPTPAPVTKPPKPTLHPLDVWLHRRHALLSKKAAKVVLFAYMRGGSSIGGEMFNIEPKATMWYEPGDAFYSTYFGIEGNLPQNDIYRRDLTRRPAGIKEMAWITDYYTKIFTCDYDNLPPLLFSHPGIKQSAGLKNFTSCMSEMKPLTKGTTCVNYVKKFCGTRYVESSWMSNCHSILEVARSVVGRRGDTSLGVLTTRIKDSLSSQHIPISPVIASGLDNFTLHELCVRELRNENSRCLPIAINKCHRDSIRATQILRHRMEDMEHLIDANPDLFIIHYVRDPRAIASSRTQTNYLMWDKQDTRPVREAQLLCHRMLEDMKQRMKLEEKYPGVFIQVRYEDLVKDPIDTAAKVYSFINIDVPKSWPEYADRILHGSDSKPFAIGRAIANASLHLSTWQRRIPPDELKQINEVCKETLLALKYPL